MSKLLWVEAAVQLLIHSDDRPRALRTIVGR
jgi:hypothetical protein